jgi:hypothetical protein
MEHVQGYIGSHWTLPSGNYSLYIAPSAARVTANKTTMKNAPTLLANSMAVAVCRYNTVHITKWRKYMAVLEATKRRHQGSTRSDNIYWTHQSGCL